MDKTEIDSAFFALTDSLELDADGRLEEYIPVDTEIQELLAMHRGRLAQHADIATMNEDEVHALQQELKSSLWIDFVEHIDGLRFGDEIALSNNGLALILDLDTEGILDIVPIVKTPVYMERSVNYA